MSRSHSPRSLARRLAVAVALIGLAPPLAAQVPELPNAQSLPPEMVQQLLQQRPEMAQQLRDRLGTSGLSPDQVAGGSCRIDAPEFAARVMNRASQALCLRIIMSNERTMERCRA